MESKLDKTVDLIKLGLQIIRSSKSVQDTVSKSQKQLILKVSNVVKSVPSLSIFDSDTPIFRCYQRRLDKSFAVSTLAIYNDENTLKLFDADLNPISIEYKIDKLVLSSEGYGLVTFGKTQFKVGLTYADQFIKDNTDFHLETETINDKIISWVSTPPKPETPLHHLEIGQDYTLVKVTGKTRKYDSLMGTVKDEQGNVVKDVILNAELNKMVESYGEGFQFRISDIRNRLNKDGKPIDAEGKVNRDRPSKIVEILDLQDVIPEIEL